MADQPPPSGSATSFLGAWGMNSIPPASLATLVLALHGRPPQPFPLIFVPVLFSATWLHLDDRHRDGAAISASASGLYALLAWRRKQEGGVRVRFLSVRGVVRGAAMALGALNCVAGAWTYVTRSEELDKRERREADRWGKEGGS